MLGNIYHDSFDCESTPPKPKFYIIIGVTDDLSEFATVYINSGININFISEDLKALNLIIEQSKYPFLDKDSFIDCSQIKTRVTIPFQLRLEKSEVRHKTMIDEKTLQLIKETVRNGGSILPYYIKKFNI